jgi:hypothetical protein
MCPIKRGVRLREVSAYRGLTVVTLVQNVGMISQIILSVRQWP